MGSGIIPRRTCGFLRGGARGIGRDFEFRFPTSKLCPSLIDISAHADSQLSDHTAADNSNNLVTAWVISAHHLNVL